MIKTPFKAGHKRTHDEADVRESSRTSQTSWKWRHRLEKAPEGTEQGRRREQQPGLASIQATFGMEVAGSTLMTAAPARPRQRAWHVARNRPDEMSEQMAH